MSVSGQTSSPSGAAPVRFNPFTESQTNEVKRIISETVANLLKQGEDVTATKDVDIEGSGDISEGERIPDIVKTLREFSGKPGEFSSWRKAVDRIMNIYESQRGTTKYFTILHTVRHKIVGEADTALESYRTPLNWKAIRKCLVLHFSDKRDISTLEYQMTVLSQGGQTITDFYQKVYHHLSLILDKIDCLDIGNEALDVLTQTYRDKALDTFIRGLNGNLPSLMSVTNPTSLPQALNACLKLGNLGVRIQHATEKGSRPNRIPQTNPPRHFYPQLTIGDRNFQGDQRYRGPTQYRYRNFRSGEQQYGGPANFSNRPPVVNNFGHPQYGGYRPPLPPKPAVPMDVDQSIQTRQVNYQNRPQLSNAFNNVQPNFKRNNSGNIHQPQKQQRMFNVEAQIREDAEPDEMNGSDEQEYEVSYDEAYEEDLDDQLAIVDDVNFLD